MQPLASPLRRLAWLALLSTLALGCAHSPRPPPLACLGRYEVQSTDAAPARQQARDVSDLLAERLGRKAMVFSSVGALYRSVLEDEAVDPASRVKIVVTNPEGPVWWVSLVKSTPDEDDRVRALRAQVEQTLRAFGVKWTYDLTDRAVPQ